MSGFKFSLNGESIQDEGTPIGNFTTLNFIGGGVSVVANGLKADITISGSSSSTSYAKALVAFAGGGQAGATQIATTYARFDTVATDGDSAKLPAAVAGNLYYVQNYGDFDLWLYPAVGENFIDQAANDYIVIVSGSKINLMCYENGTFTII